MFNAVGLFITPSIWMFLSTPAGVFFMIVVAILLFMIIGSMGEYCLPTCGIGCVVVIIIIGIIMIKSIKSTNDEEPNSKKNEIYLIKEIV